MSLRAGLGAAVVSATLARRRRVDRPEGPVVHLWERRSAPGWRAACASSGGAQPGRLLRLRPWAAGWLAASFNAPIAGVFFAPSEVVVGHSVAPVRLRPDRFSLRLVTGDRPQPAPLRQFPGLRSCRRAIRSPRSGEFPAFALLGVVSAAGGGSSSLFLVKLWSRTGVERAKVPWVIRSAIGRAGGRGDRDPVSRTLLGVGYEATPTLPARGSSASALLVALIGWRRRRPPPSASGSASEGGSFRPGPYFLGAMTGGGRPPAFALIRDRALFPGIQLGPWRLHPWSVWARVAGAVLGAPI